MSDQPLRLAVIVGSVREGRFGPTVAQWFADQAGQRDDIVLDVIDAAEDALPLAMPGYGGRPTPEAARTLESLTPKLTDADAFVVVTPEYNHSFPAALKNLIDWYKQQWHAKPVGFVSYGGVSGGLRAVEQLRLVFAELHAVTVRDTVSFHQAGARFDDSGSPLSADECNAAAKVMLDQLSWWGHALRDFKDKHPYAA